MPHSTGPIMDQTGEACAQGQQGPIWFLAGTGAGPVIRSCTIPADKVLFFPLINHILNPPNFWTEELDPFTVYLDDDNYASQFGLEGGYFDHATIGGHFAFLRQLSPGTHTLEFGGATCFEDGSTEFEVSAFYNLTVE